MLRGRLGLETARIPHADRHGLLWLSRGALTVGGGTLRFDARADRRPTAPWKTGSTASPSNAVDDPARSRVDGQPRRAAPHGSPWHRPRRRGRGRRPVLHRSAAHARHLRHRPPADASVGRPTWKPHNNCPSDVRPATGGVLPHQSLDALRGIEGARMKRTYQTLTQRYGITWRGRRYDRTSPLSADIPNQAINHASVAVTAAAVIAVTAVGAIPSWVSFMNTAATPSP